jgi:hypothetical protein
VHLLALLATPSRVASSVAAAAPNVTLNDTFLFVAIVGGFVTILGVLFGVYRAIKNSGIKDKRIDDMLASQPSEQEKAQSVVRNLKQDQVFTKVIGDGTLANPGWDAKFLAIDTRLVRIESAMSPNGLNTNQIGDMARRTELAVDQLAKGLAEHKRLSDETHLAMWTAITDGAAPKGEKT